MRRLDGEKLRTVREKAFLSQGELAKKAHVNRNTINRIEKGIVRVHPSTIRKVAEALTVEPSSLIPD